MRVYTDQALVSGQNLLLVGGATRHIQVLRMQPGEVVTLFNGLGGEYQAEILRMGRSDVELVVQEHLDIEREAKPLIHLYVGMPANERMDWLVEKATELGVASITPLQTQRSVLKLDSARASKKLLHWQGIASAACEQSGRNRLPVISAPLSLNQALEKLKAEAINQSSPEVPHPNSAQFTDHAFVLSFSSEAKTLNQAIPTPKQFDNYSFFSGPEGGFSATEEELLLNAKLIPLTLGNRTLRAETAPLAILSALTLSAQG